MTLAPWDWIIIIGCVATSWLLGRKARDPSTWRGYFLASGQMGGLSVGATYVGANLTFTSIFLILSEEAYRRGLVVLCIPVFWILGTLVFVKVYPRLVRRGVSS